MAITGNFKGTLNASFTIGKRGATVYQGDFEPNTGTGNVGDIFLRTTVGSSAIYQKTGTATWTAVGGSTGGTGTVTSVVAGSGLTGGTISGTGTIGISTGSIQPSLIVNGNGNLVVKITGTAGTSFGLAVDPESGLQVAVDANTIVHNTAGPAIGSSVRVLRLGTTGTAGTYSKIVTDIYGRVSSGGSALLDDLGDVVIATPSTDQVLKYNGTNWVNGTVTSGGTGTITGLVTGNGITLNGSVGTVSSGIGTIGLNTGTLNSTLTFNSGTAIVKVKGTDGTSFGLYVDSEAGLQVAAGGGIIFGSALPVSGSMLRPLQLEPIGSAGTYNQIVTNQTGRVISGTFIPAGTGTVTSVVAGAGLAGGTISSSGTISLGTVGVIGTYNQVLTDQYGRVISGTNITPNLDDLGDVVVSSPSTNQFLRYDGTNWINQTVTAGLGDVVGPVSSQANGVAVYNDVTGKVIRDSSMTISPSGNANILGNFAANNLYASLSGSAGAPSISFLNDLDTGFYNDVANSIAISAGGSFIGRFGTAGLLMSNGTTGVTLNPNGLTFPASQAPSSNVNTLDDYEEGNWTPVGAGGYNCTGGAGSYIKIGKLLYLRGSFTGVAGQSSGVIPSIGGVPYSMALATGYIVYPNGASWTTACVSTGATTFGFYAAGSWASAAAVGGNSVIFGALAITND